MLLDDIEIERRLNSPDNLINQLRDKLEGRHINRSVLPVIDLDSNEANNLDRIQPSSGSELTIPSLPDMDVPDLDELVSNAADKIKLATAKTSALDCMNDTLTELRVRIPEAESPTALAKIAAQMGHVINSLSFKDHIEDSRASKNVIIYKPVLVNESHYNTIQVNE